MRGFGDMANAEVASITGLAMPAAARARCREWTETFEIVCGDLEALRAELARYGLSVVRGGRFLTASGPHDKGTAVNAVLRLLDGAITSWAVGDAPNDGPMLAAVDRPLLVRSVNGAWADVDVPGLSRLHGIGPVGFVEAARLVVQAMEE